jgi:hypothetical protein
MDISIVIAALNLLVNSFDKARALWREKKRREKITGAIHLLRIIQVLDRIVETGTKLISLLSTIPITENADATRYALLRTKKEIVDLVKTQVDNLKEFSEIYSSNILEMGSQTGVSLGDTIKFMMPDQTEKIQTFKGAHLRVLTWKLLDGEPSYGQLRRAATSALHALPNSVKVDERLTVLNLSFPVRFIFTESADIESTRTYDLKDPNDLKLLLSNAKNDLDSIRDYRQRLAELIRTTFTFADLLRTD